MFSVYKLLRANNVFDKKRVYIFKNCIPLSVRAAETTAEGKSIYLHDPKGIVAKGYISLTEEVLAYEE